MSAVQEIRNPRSKSSQRIIHDILQASSELKSSGTPLRLQWISGHCNDPGNDAADKLAKGHLAQTTCTLFCRLISQERTVVRKILQDWKHEWKLYSKGGHLRRIDPKLPRTQTRRLYDPLPWNRVYQGFPP